MNKHHKNHKLLWNELARTGSDDKLSPFKNIKTSPAYACFACESVGGYSRDCTKCPIDWTKRKNDRTCCFRIKNSPYRKWADAKTPRTRKKYALIIANMKWRTKK